MQRVNRVRVASLDRSPKYLAYLDHVHNSSSNPANASDGSIRPSPHGLSLLGLHSSNLST